MATNKEIATIKSLDHIDSEAQLTCQHELRGALFQYESLENAREIRLLRLPPFVFAGEVESIEWTLTPVPLRERPKYLAISYVWGNGRLTVPLSVNGKKLYITESLAIALRYITKAVMDAQLATCSPFRGIGYIWADAICIDQQNEDEKSHQVRMMFEIYSKAQAVIGWLGRAEGRADYALQVLGELGRVLPRFAGQYKTLPSHHAEARRKEVFALMRQKVIEESFAISSIQSLLENPFWRRVWILQETIAPRALYYLCEGQLVDWLDLFTSIFIIREFEYVDDPILSERWLAFQKSSIPIFRMLNQRSKRCVGVPRASLLELLKPSRGELQATDPRDLIYALLNVASNAHQYQSILDYSKSTVDLYVDMARTLFLHETLVEAQNLSNSNRWLPSWVPDWKISPSVSIGRSFSVRGNLIFSRSTVKSSSILQSDPKHLAIRGLRIDMPENITQYCWADMQGPLLDTAETWFKSFDSLIGPFKSISYSPYSESHQQDVAIRYTAIAWAKAYDSTEAYYDMYKIIRGSMSPPKNVFDEKAWRTEKSLPYITRMREIAVGRKAFITSQGYVCLGPSSVQAGDLLCVFEADVPFVIRPAGEGQYELLGEAYVYNHMFGRLVEGRQDFEEFILV